MFIKLFVFNDFRENTYLLYDESLVAIVVDPGMNDDEERKAFDTFVQKKNLQIKSIINTHCHIDHVLGCKYLKEKYNIPFYIHKNEAEVLEGVEHFGLFLGIETERPPMPDGFFSEDDMLSSGNTRLKVIFVPGHTPGGVAFYCAEDNVLITGDTLFRGSIGRTDFPGGDHNTLINSIKTNIMTLPGNVTVLPGHGPSTTIEEERNSNPFLM